ncbi:MAG: hypothetical protein Q9187_003959 [Circinaria calcarea]
MSLYYEAAQFISASDQQLGSLKSSIYGAKGLKSTPAQLFALVSEASKWSSVVKEVVEKSQLLVHERKLSPTLALLLVYDLLLAKKGIAAPAAHPLRVAVERHKARIHAEFTKSRLRRGFSSVEELRQHVNRWADGDGDLKSSRGGVPASAPEGSIDKWPHPRWVRINTLKTSLDEQLATTFANYTRVDTIDKVLTQATRGQPLYVDKHIPNLIALSSSTEVFGLPAYQQGLLILQDKASCFPAYLLDPRLDDGDIVDSCAAPGNKTTHIAALLKSHESQGRSTTIWACERDTVRAKVLQRMVTVAGADDLVNIKAGQDFLRLDPQKDPWCNVGALLLDPSCSGSGIVGRDEKLSFDLPSREVDTSSLGNSKKRKRREKEILVKENPNQEIGEEIAIPVSETVHKLQSRLASLSTFQTKLLLHAMSFPRARKVTYSTCSSYAEENENVVLNALLSDSAVQNGWKILSRNEQINGMRSWPIRGNVNACRNGSIDKSLAEDLADACIRCEKGTREGTQGFFVAAFVRDFSDGQTTALEDEWEGFGED